MSTGKRLAKRSIVGTRVCALGGDGRYYPGVIHAVRTTAPAGTSSGPGENRYSVRFDSSPPPRRVHPREFRDSEIVGPGFRSVTNVRLRSGQKVFLTYNGREVAGRVLEVGEWEEDRSEEEDEGSLGGNAEESVPGEGEEEEDFEEEESLEEGGRKTGRMGRRGRRRGTSVASQAGVEVLVAILPPGHDAPLQLRKRQEEIRLLESRKSARLMDHQDTDFARLADMVGGGERRRTSSHSIDVPGPSPSSSGVSSASSSASSASLTSHSGGSRKRRPSEGWSSMEEPWGSDGPTEGMDECTAALVLMRLSCSPHSPHRFERFPIKSDAYSWGEQLSPCSSDAALGSSWQSGNGGHRSTPSPPLSSDGSVTAYNSSNSRWSTLNTTDDGIFIDAFEELPKKKKPMSRVEFQCTWPGCSHRTTNCSAIETHVRNAHLGPRENDDSDLSDHEEEFYYQEVELADATTPYNGSRVSGSVLNGGIAPKQNGVKTTNSGSTSPTVPLASPPTLSHRDMARPPHEDPEYQKQLHSAAALRHNSQVAGPITIPAETIMWSSQPAITSPASPQKYLKLSPRPSSGLSPSRKMRGETKKCRKVYGMEHRDMWCTQCKWKKACSRFGD